MAIVRLKYFNNSLFLIFLQLFDDIPRNNLENLNNSTPMILKPFNKRNRLQYKGLIKR